jgi:hypothetical protein
MRLFGYLYAKRFGSKTIWANRKLVAETGRVRDENQVVEDKDPRSGGQRQYVREKRRCVEARKGRYRMVEIKLLCFRWLSAFFMRVQKRFPGFAYRQAIFSIYVVWVHFQFSRPMYTVFAERSFLSSRLINGQRLFVTVLLIYLFVLVSYAFFI